MPFPSFLNAFHFEAILAQEYCHVLLSRMTITDATGFGSERDRRDVSNAQGESKRCRVSARKCKAPLTLENLP